jgi:very-short-patch-repair endonuclease
VLNYNANLKDKARHLRKNLRDSEKALWFRLRNKQLLGIQFYGQKPIGGHIVDFFAPRAKLVVEVEVRLENEIVKKLLIDCVKVDTRQWKFNREEIYGK